MKPILTFTGVLFSFFSSAQQDGVDTCKMVPEVEYVEIIDQMVKADLVKSPIVWDDNSTYKALAMHFDSICQNLKQSAEANFHNDLKNALYKLKSGKNALAGSGVEAIMEEYEEQYQNSIAYVKKLEDISRQLKYKHRTQNRLSFFPVRNESDLMQYDQFNTTQHDKFLNETKIMIQPGQDFLSLFSEWYKDYFGMTRVSIGTMLNTYGPPENEDPDYSEWESGEEPEMVPNQEIAKITSGGGFLVLKSAVPAMLYQNANHSFSIKSEIQNRIGIDLPILGTASSQYAMNTEFDIYHRIYISGSNQQIALVGEARLGWITGNQSFYDRIDKKDGAPFFMHQLSLGLILSNKFQLSWTSLTGDDFVTENAQYVMSFSMVME